MKTYQKIYNTVPWYGSVKHNRCPGMLLMSYYKPWLSWHVLDYGCGRGDVVVYLRKEGKRAIGYDIIKPEKKNCYNDFIKLNTKIIPERTTFLCIDVLEHLSQNEIRNVLEYSTCFKNQIISVCNRNSKIQGQELHKTLKPFEWWVYELSHYLQIAQVNHIHKHQRLYKCKTRN